LPGLNSQLYALSAHSACAADLSSIASMHGGWFKKGRTASGIGSRVAAVGVGCGNGGVATDGRLQGPPLDSVLLDRGLQRRQLHDPMAEMQASLCVCVLAMYVY
jgi:hypothetical protein